MNTNKQILMAHYRNIARRAALWLGLVSILASSFIATTPAMAASQLTARKATLSNAAGGVTSDNVAFSFTFGSSYTVKGIKIQLCNSPLPGTCTSPSGASLNSVTSISGTSGGCASFAFNTKSATDYTITYSTGNAVTTASACGVTLNGVTNPTTQNQQFYFRITTYTDTALSTPAGGQDFGGIAVSTSQTIAVSGTVQENLLFCSGTGGTAPTGNVCTNVTGNAVNFGIMNTGFSSGTSQLYAATNASTGYTVQYYTTNANTGSCTGNNGFCDVNSGQIGTDTGLYSSPTAGTTEDFGINLNQTNTSTTSTGAATTGDTASLTYGTNYATNNTFKFTGAGGDAIITKTVPSTLTTYNVDYMANVTSTTKPGSYAVNFNYVCTGIF